MRTSMIRGKTDSTVERMARECVGNQLRMLSRVVTGVYEDELRPLRLKVSQMIILALTEKRGQVRAVELSQELRMDSSTVSRNVERMRARGWLEHVPGEDERSHPFRLTSSGRKVLRDATVAWKRAQAKAVGLLGKEGVALLRLTTRKVTAQESAN
jgi:DNA-binding MarR family transcriptional regulator